MVLKMRQTTDPFVVEKVPTVPHLVHSALIPGCTDGNGSMQFWYRGTLTAPNLWPFVDQLFPSICGVYFGNLLQNRIFVGWNLLRLGILLVLQLLQNSVIINYVGQFSQSSSEIDLKYFMCIDRIWKNCAIILWYYHVIFPASMLT